MTSYHLVFNRSLWTQGGGMIRKPSNPSARAGRRVLVNVVAPFIGVTLALSGCSWVPDWANPMTAYDSIFSDDPAPTGAGQC